MMANIERKPEWRPLPPDETYWLYAPPLRWTGYAWGYALIFGGMMLVALLSDVVGPVPLVIGVSLGVAGLVLGRQLAAHAGMEWPEDLHTAAICGAAVLMVIAGLSAVLGDTPGVSGAMLADGLFVGVGAIVGWSLARRPRRER